MRKQCLLSMHWMSLEKINTKVITKRPDICELRYLNCQYFLPRLLLSKLQKGSTMEDFQRWYPFSYKVFLLWKGESYFSQKKWNTSAQKKYRFRKLLYSKIVMWPGHEFSLRTVNFIGKPKYLRKKEQCHLNEKRVKWISTSYHFYSRKQGRDGDS